nr:transposase [Nocardia nova]
MCTWVATTTPPTRPRWSSDASPRIHDSTVHFTPTGSSWLNQVERWFTLCTQQLLRRSVHKSVAALEEDVRNWVDQRTLARSGIRARRVPTSYSSVAVTTSASSDRCISGRTAGRNTAAAARPEPSSRDSATRRTAR